MTPGAGAPDPWPGTRALVLGASGFIGGWVTRALAARQAEVVLATRRADGVAPLRDAGIGSAVAVADLSAADAVRALVERWRPAVVFNLAGYGVDRGERDERVARIVNAELPRWVVEAMTAHGDDAWRGQRVVHTGSALEYGEIGGDLAEDSAPNPTTLYGRTKLAGTLAVADTCARHGARGLTARLFTVYGAGEHAGRLLPTLLEAARDDRPVPMSAGLQQRDFTYVEDVAEGLLRLGALESVEPGAVVNLATGRLTTVRRFATEAASVLGLAPERLDFGAIPTRAEEMQHDPVSVARLRALLGWAPATPIAEGVRRTARIASQAAMRSR